MSREYYHIEHIVEIFGLDQALLDRLESEELIESYSLPPRGERVFLPEQVERIRVIRNLMRDLEVNLEGCGVILEMREQMMRMEKEFDRILEALIKQLQT